MLKAERQIVVLLPNSSLQHGGHPKRNVGNSIIPSNSWKIKKNNDKHKKQLKLLDDVKKHASPQKLHPKKCSPSIHLAPVLAFQEQHHPTSVLSSWLNVQKTTQLIQWITRYHLLHCTSQLSSLKLSKKITIKCLRSYLLVLQTQYVQVQKQNDEISHLSTSWATHLVSTYSCTQPST